MSIQYPTTLPKPSDSEQVLFRKLVQVLGGKPSPFDGVYPSLAKVLTLLSAAAVNPLDPQYDLARKLLDLANGSGSAVADAVLFNETTTSAFNFNGVSFVKTLSLPLFTRTSADHFFVTGNQALVTLNIPKFVVSAFDTSTYVNDNPALTTLDASASVWEGDGGTFTATGNAFSAASVNAFLVRAATFIGVAFHGTIDLSGGTSAAPTGAGAAAKTALQGAAWFVTTN